MSAQSIVHYRLDYLSAADSFAAIRRDTGDIVGGLTEISAVAVRVAGGDRAGAAWSSAYDSAVSVLADAATAVVNGCGQLADLLAAGAANHANADAAATIGAAEPLVVPQPGPDPIAIPMLGSVSGGSGATPWGWSLFGAGFGWPDGDPERLSTTRAAWFRVADLLTTAAAPIPEALGRLEKQQSPEIPVALTHCGRMIEQLEGLAEGARVLGRACGEYAELLDTAQQSILIELRALLIDTAAVEGGGMSGGAFGLFDNSVIARRIAVAAERIGHTLEELHAQALLIAARIASHSDQLSRISIRMRDLLSARVKLWQPTTKSTAPRNVRNAQCFPNSRENQDNRIEECSDELGTTTTRTRGAVVTAAAGSDRS